MRLTIFRSVMLAAVVTAVSLGQFAPAAYGQVQRPGQMFVGETLKYEGKLNKVLHGITIAELTFTASSDAGTSNLVVNTEAVSKGTLVKLFHFSFLQQYGSTIDLDTFRILKTTKHDVQKERVRDSEALFDYPGKRVTFTETDPKDPNRTPRRIASEISDQMNDMVSAIYAVRLLDLSVGKKFELSVSDSGLIYKIPVVVTGRELQKTVLGDVWCFRVEPQIFGKDRLIEKDGKMVIWMTDDKRHIPVHALISASVGKIEVKLRSVTNSK